MHKATVSFGSVLPFGLGVSNGSCDGCLRFRRVAEASRLLRDCDDCSLSMCRFVAVSCLFVLRVDSSAYISSAVQSATEVSRRFDGRSNSFIWVCIAVSLNVTNGFSVWCLRVRRVAEASRLLCECDGSYLCMCRFSAVSRLFVLRSDSSAYASSATGVS